jgi:AbiV family abortive infection protein
MRDGIVSSQNNAIQLLRDAITLAEANRGETATALAVLAIEEAAKLPILMALRLCVTEQGLRNRWRDFRDHRAKMAVVHAPFGEAAADVKARQVALTVLKSVSLDAVKELALYSDCIVADGGPEWHTPQMPAETVTAILGIAKLVVGRRIITDAEIDLWMERVAPFAEAPTPEFQRRVLAFEEAAIAAGLRDLPLRDGHSA